MNNALLEILGPYFVGFPLDFESVKFGFLLYVEKLFIYYKYVWNGIQWRELERDPVWHLSFTLWMAWIITLGFVNT